MENSVLRYVSTTIALCMLGKVYWILYCAIKACNRPKYKSWFSTFKKTFKNELGD
jgi:hypothetical protein